MSALQPSRPLDARHAGLVGGGLEIAEAGGPQGRNRGAGVDDLVAADEPRARQVEKPVVVLVDETAALLVGGEILAADQDRLGAEALGALAQASRRPRHNPAARSRPGSPRLKMPAFSAAIAAIVAPR